MIECQGCHNHIDESETWSCASCGTQACVWCYIKHNDVQHSWLYERKQQKPATNENDMSTTARTCTPHERIKTDVSEQLELFYGR